ncbi:peptide chain release factor N(5)-glutamine methyltransferase [Clostridium vincentii]|uniref:Release factor glutamine methyltransferase n=1 Tax=Clostridium vincentii TaxID=52704 RepID=A0A2T0BH42_9CLOT|nr:peptide chain release factor N(5)-glutamine methyltransferase [Clostridium vincentii]PRR83163.1 Release factor glutamine methyltransferase [Clostridium vincentii]
MKKSDVGGQAVIEGVMMRGTKGLATAVRREDGEISIKCGNVVPITKRYTILNIPFLRGIFVLIDSLKIGMSALNYSSSFFEDTESSKFETWLRKKFGEKSNDVIMGFTMILALIVSIGLFVGIPTGVASLFKRFELSAVGLNLIEAFIRMIILVTYIYGISVLDDIYRVFQYHGAEHKTIFCYEAEERLTVENVKKFSRFHPRCGTNFLFLIMLVSVFIISFTGWGGFFERLLIRIILIPVVSGITYEIIKWLGKSESKIAKAIAYPGLQLQRLTTKEPDNEHIEVAIAALLAAEGLEEEEMTIVELINIGAKTLNEVKIDSARLDAQLLLGKVLDKNKIYIITNKEEKVSNKNKKQYLALIKKRKAKMPIKYILGEGDFMGLDFFLEEGVLIPRSDTEVLVEQVLKMIPENEDLEVCDLCCGSGAIGIALAHYKKNIRVECIDFYAVPEKVTKKNTARNHVEDRVNYIKSDLLEVPINEEKKYNVIVSNPPYIREEEIDSLMQDVKNYEPRSALSGGEDGLLFYRKIVDQSKKVLIKEGILSFEIGYDQGETVKNLMEDNGYQEVKVIKDLSGLDRVVYGKFSY